MTGKSQNVILMNDTSLALSTTDTPDPPVTLFRIPCLSTSLIICFRICWGWNKGSRKAFGLMGPRRRFGWKTRLCTKLFPRVPGLLSTSFFLKLISICLQLIFKYKLRWKSGEETHLAPETSRTIPRAQPLTLMIPCMSPSWIHIPSTSLIFF